MKKTLAILILFLLPIIASAKPTYRITVQIDGATDSTLLLGYYYAQNRFILDTARNNGRGKFVFESEKELYPGLYFFTNNNDRLTEFIVYKEKPFFTLHTDNSAWTMKMKVKGSQQNDIFFAYQKESESVYQQIDSMRTKLDSASFADYQHRQHLRIDSIKNHYINHYPNAMFARMINATKNVDELVPVEHPDGTKLTDHERYMWYMHHYFDFIPIDDDFIIRTPKPVFYQRIVDYTDKYMRGMPPEEICPLLDTLLDRAEPANQVFRWLLHHLTEKYLQSNIMVYDEVYVHLVQRYFATGRAPWYPPSAIDEQVERANKWERLLVGREAPELVLFDTLRRPHSLHRLGGKYTLLVFWSPTCGHCREIIPAIYRAFDQLADSLNLTAFAILTEPDDHTVGKWKQFLADHHITNPRWVNLNGGEANIDWREVYDITTTPQIYLIENDKHTFIAKKLNADLFRQICKQLK
ncbi:MAG: DUF5106 domain-containing protein [Bacteroidales bacterium]|nr:DUF5106 domain-containing protein [Bacteroidales bacterium]